MASRNAGETLVSSQHPRTESRFGFVDAVGRHVRSLIEASLDPVVLTGPDEKVTHVNAATERATGRSHTELVGTDFCQYFTEPAQARTAYEQVIREGMVRDYPLELRHRDGRVMSVLYSASVCRDESHRISGVFATARDVSERTQGEDGLRTSDARLGRERDRLHLLLEINNHIVGKLDPTELFQAVAQSVRRYFGNDVTSLLILDNETGCLGRTFVDCPGSGGFLEKAAVTLPSELLNAWWRIARPVRYSPWGTDVRAALREADRAESILSAISVPLVGADGPLGLFNIASRQAQAFNDADLDLLEQIGTQIAVALDNALAYERLRASRDALRRSEAYLAEAQRLSHTGSWAYDVSASKYAYLSEECFRVFELDAQAGLPLRETVARLIHSEDWYSVNESFEKALREKVDTSTEFRITLPSGRTKHILVFRHPVLNDAGELVQLVGTVVDITERKRAEEALRESENERRRAEVTAREARAHLERVARLKTMGELAASIAHEVNQPLAALITSANAGLRWLAREPPNVTKARAALARVVRDGTRAGEVVARIRGAVRRAPSILHRVDMNDVVRDVLPLMIGELRQHNVDVSLALDAVAPEVLGDGIQLQQVLLNIVKNAIDAMADVEDRPRALRIESAVAALDGDPAVVVQVTDTGPGLGLVDAERLFEPFQTTKPHGMGMGLWISRLIVEAHNGRLTAHATDGPGATFEILLPAVNE